MLSFAYLGDNLFVFDQVLFEVHKEVILNLMYLFPLLGEEEATVEAKENEVRQLQRGEVLVRARIDHFQRLLIDLLVEALV